MIPPAPLVVLLVALAGGAGAVLRYGTVLLLARLAPAFPWGVLVVNTVGSAIGGAAIGGLVPAELLGGAGSVVVLVGFCGGLSTFSTFAVDNVQLAERDESLLKANLNALANVALGVGAAFGAYWLTTVLGG